MDVSKCLYCLGFLLLCIAANTNDGKHFHGKEMSSYRDPKCKVDKVIKTIVQFFGFKFGG